MTPEEAINCFDLISVLDAPGLKKGLEMAKEALEKQIPKKPNIHIKGTTGYNTLAFCPECGNIVGCSRYCPRFGQALDWSEGNKKCHFK